MANKKLPPVDPALIEWLESKYPNEVPKLSDSEREVWVKVGHQEVIDHLKGIIQKILKDNL